MLCPHCGSDRLSATIQRPVQLDISTNATGTTKIDRITPVPRSYALDELGPDTPIVCRDCGRPSTVRDLLKQVSLFA